MTTDEGTLVHRLKRGLCRLLGIRRPTDPRELGRWAQEGATAGLSRPSSLPGSLTLAQVASGPQTGTQGCNGDPFDFRPCAGVCDYEETQHDCTERTGGASC